MDDDTAWRVLSAVAKARRHGQPPPQWTADLRQATQEATGLSPESAAQAGRDEGELARQALLLAARDPQAGPALAAMIEHPPVQKFDLGLTGAAVTLAAVLVILRTHIEFERDKAGKWKLRVKVTRTPEAVLKPLVQKLLSFLPGDGPPNP